MSLPLSVRRRFARRRAGRTAMATGASGLLLASLLSTPERAPAICLAGIPRVTCAGSGGKAPWKIEWADQSACGCTSVEISERACGGVAWIPITDVDCGTTAYWFCEIDGDEREFRIRFLDAQRQPTVADVVSSCVTCGTP